MSDPRKLTVELGARAYPILIGTDWLDDLGTSLRAHGFAQRHAFVVTDSNAGGLYFNQVENSLAAAGFEAIVSHELPAGEQHKNWREFGRCCDALLGNFGHSASAPLLLNLGGGVIGDLGGFAAGVFRRGIPYVMVPTTLLSCVDSSVGGKVGVNHGQVKNILGMFHQPRLVFIDGAFLRTLPARELRSGLAEIIKYGAVCSAELFGLLEQRLDDLLKLEPVLLSRVIYDCCQLKAEVVQQDELDTRGIRNVLNFGHTIGHALEMAAAGELTHGEAISIGMCAATRLAVRLGKCEAAFLERLRMLLHRAGLPQSLPDASFSAKEVYEIMMADKKFRQGENLFVLPTGAGSWSQERGVPQLDVDFAIQSALALS